MNPRDPGTQPLKKADIDQKAVMEFAITHKVVHSLLRRATLFTTEVNFFFTFSQGDP